ncbi:MAG: S1 RNA-binding domain-containing protein [Eubacterium sp.]|nr:S1 RNA-binding domain-containing protein [Eubacterium sp.]
MTEFLPEGRKITDKENTAALQDIRSVEKAAKSGRIYEAPCIVCDTEHNMIVDLGCMRGVIERGEGALGIDDGTTRDIALISRVSKPVCFIIKGINRSGSEAVAVLSRKEAQQRAKDEYISKLQSGDVIPARVTHLEQFGCFVDIGCGLPSMIPIDTISVSRITHPSDRFAVGQDIFAAVKGRDGDRICLTHKELLGTWGENAGHFCAGQTVPGIIRSVEDYGIFVELAPNLAGLAELKPGVRAGDFASVYIKAIIPEKMKIKLIIVSSYRCDAPPAELNYYITDGHIDRWVYSTEQAGKYIATEFNE